MGMSEEKSRQNAGLDSLGKKSSNKAEKQLQVAEMQTEVGGKRAILAL